MTRMRALLVVPENNTTMEGEMRAYCPQIHDLLVARVSRPARTLLREDIPAYRASTLKAVEPFEGEAIDILLYGCTAAGFLAGPEGESELACALSARFGVETVTTAGAMVAVLQDEKVTRIDVVTPYLEAVNEGLKAYLAAGGITVERLESFSCATTAELGAIGSAEVLALARATASREAQALFIACSQLPTRAILPRLRRELRRPVRSSIEATAWAASKAFAAKASAAA